MYGLAGKCTRLAYITHNKGVHTLFSYWSNNSLALLWMESGLMVAQSPMANTPSAPNTLRYGSVTRAFL